MHGAHPETRGRQRHAGRGARPIHPSTPRRLAGAASSGPGPLQNVALALCWTEAIRCPKGGADTLARLGVERPHAPQQGGSGPLAPAAFVAAAARGMEQAPLPAATPAGHLGNALRRPCTESRVSQELSSALTHGFIELRCAHAPATKSTSKPGSSSTSLRRGRITSPERREERVVS